MTDQAIADSFEEIVRFNPSFSQEGQGPRRLLVMSGLPLSGKTYFVKRAMKKWSGRFLRVNSHDIRPVVVKKLGRKRPIYDKKEHVATFEAAHLLVKKGLEMSWPVIADATNLKEEYREWAISAGDLAGAETLVVFLQVSEDGARKRLKERTSSSSATFDTFQRLKYEMESPDRCSKPYIVIDSEVDIRPHITNISKWLSGELDKIPNVKHPAKPRPKPEPKLKNKLVDFYTGEEVEED